MTELVTREMPADGVQRLTINRPDQHNAISLEVQRSIDAAVIEAAGDPAVRCVLLTGAGERAFSAGYDIRELTEMGEGEHLAVQLERDELLWRWYASAVPTVTALRGITYGAGASGLACCPGWWPTTRCRPRAWSWPNRSPRTTRRRCAR